MNPQQAHDIVNKEINVILKEIEKIKIEGCDECMFSYGKWVLCETCKSKLEYKISKLKGIISQEATEIEDKEDKTYGCNKYIDDKGYCGEVTFGNTILLCPVCNPNYQKDDARLQALKISIADLQEQLK